MSWIVQTLLSSSLKIHSDSDIESDEFNDLLLVEAAVKKLKEEGILSEYESTLIEMFSDGSFKKDVSKTLKKNRGTIIRDFDAVCDRIAFYLGDYFTNDGYISYLENKYKLTSQQIERFWEFIRSKHRHKNVRITNNNKENL